jgi:tartrate-resistant acid phosphatase type 5
MRGAALAACLLAVGAATGCCGCAPVPTFTVRNGPAKAPRPAPALSAPAVRALHVGDFGDSTCQQQAVAAAIAAAHARAPFDVGFASGDLVYDCGADPRIPGASACAFAADGNTIAPGFTPPVDPAFGVHDGPLAFLGATPVHPALGNHDVAATGGCGAGWDPAVAARLKACLAVAHASPQWVMPGRHYAVDRGPARFVVVDSNVVEDDYGGFTLDEEVAFVVAQARGCADRVCFLVGHHPPATAGEHQGGVARVAPRMQRLLDAGAGRFRAFLAGHDHDLQHLRTAGGLDVLVSGAGSRGRWRERFDVVAPADASLLYASVRWGFGVLEVSADGWRYRFEDEEGRALYCCAAAGTGPCEPSTCG